MKWLRYIVISVNVLAAVVLLAIGAGAFLIGSEAGTAWLVERARRVLPELTIGAVSGTLAGQLRLDDVVLTIEDDRVAVDSLELSLDLGRLLARAVVIESLHIGPARVSYTAGETGSTEPPEPPFAIVVEAAELERIEVSVSGETYTVEGTRLAGSWVGSALEIERFETRIEGVDVRVTGRVELAAAPELALELAWSAELEGERWAGDGMLGGTWPVVALDHTLRAPVAVTASGTLALDTAPRMDLDLAWTDLAWPGIDMVTSPGGTLALAGDLESLRYRGSARLVAEGVPIEVVASGTASRDAIDLAPLELAAGSGRMTATGRVVIPERRFSLHVQGRDLDPSLVRADWPGRIDAEGELSGAFEPPLTIEFDEVALDGRVRDYPFSAMLAGRYRAPAAWTFERAEIVSGPDRVTISGRLDETLDLAMEAHATQLGLLWPGLDGTVDAELRLAGTLDQPRAGGAVEVTELAYGDRRLATATLSGNADLYSGGVLDLTLAGAGLDLGNVDAAEVDGRVTGTLGAHELTLALDGAEWRMAMAARGGLEGKRWGGRLERFEIEQPAAGLWRLASAAVIGLAPGELVVEEACLTRLEAELCAALAWRKSPEDRLALRARGFDLGLFAPVLPAGLALEGEYSLDATFTDLSGNPTGELSVDGGATRVSFTADEREPIAAEIDDVLVTVSLAERRLEADASLEGLETGRVHLSATVEDLSNERSPVQGRLEASWPDLAILSLLSPDVGVVSGTGEIVLDLGGTLELPEVQGRALWREGAAEIPAWGVSVERISASATSADGTALEFDAGGFVEDAELRLTGRMELDRGAGFPTTLKLSGQAVPIVQLPDAEVYVSPELDIDVMLPNVRVDGTVLVPRARLALDELPEQAVRPSDDAFVHGGSAPEPTRPLTVDADIRLVLGDQVTYTGSNLDSTLRGNLRLLYTSGEDTNASGSLRIDGSYDAYGQSLDLERGELIFTGPLDDPTLDVRAVRAVGETTVGVQLTGSLKSPQTRLFSDPAMSEADALSYLLLGRPLQGTGDEDSQIVQSAALSMGLQQALPVVQRIGETLGLDELSIEANDVDAGALMAGKYLSPKVYIRYSYGLFNRIGGLLLRFKINERFSLETRSGDEKSMDLLYTVEKE